MITRSYHQLNTGDRKTLMHLAHLPFLVYLSSFPLSFLSFLSLTSLLSCHTFKTPLSFLLHNPHSSYPLGFIFFPLLFIAQHSSVLFFCRVIPPSSALSFLHITFQSLFMLFFCSDTFSYITMMCCYILYVTI